jgi:hypothetical protein
MSHEPEVPKDAKEHRAKFLVNIESVSGQSLARSSQPPCTFLKVKFDESHTVVTTPVSDKQNPEWKGFPYAFDYDTLYCKQNQLKVKHCIFEVWENPSMLSRKRKSYFIHMCQVIDQRSLDEFSGLLGVAAIDLHQLATGPSEYSLPLYDDNDKLAELDPNKESKEEQHTSNFILVKISMRQVCA